MAEETYPRFRRMARVLTCIALAIVTIAFVLGLIGRFAWWLDLFSHFRYQYLAAFLLLSAVAALQRLRGPALLGGSLFLAAAAGPLHAWLAPRPVGAREVGTLLSFNVHTANPEKEAVLELLRREQADVVLLYEIDVPWLTATRALKELYPFTVEEPSSDNFGILMLSKHPVLSHDVRYLGAAQVPTIDAVIAYPAGPVRVIGTHPPPPVSAEYAHWRDDHMRLLAELIAKAERPGGGLASVLPTVVAGDFNATPWSSGLAPLESVGLRNARRGFPPVTTWMRDTPWISLPIDHVFTDDLLNVSKHRILESCGSDHNPVLVSLRLADPTESSF